MLKLNETVKLLYFYPFYVNSNSVNNNINNINNNVAGGFKVGAARNFSYRFLY